MLPERLTDGSVTVRRYRPDDVDALATAVEASLQELRAWMPWAAADVVADRSTDQLLGAVAMSDGRGEHEVSYQFLPDAWGRGLAIESVTAALLRCWGVDHVDEVIAVTQTANEPSIRLLDRLGFEHEDTFVEFDAEQGEFRMRLPRPTKPR